MLLPCDNLLDNFNWNINTQPTHKKQNKKTASRQLPKKNDNEEESVTENEDDGSETGEMIEFTPREIQTFSKENSDKIEKKEKEGHKVDEKVDFSIEQRREKVVRPKGNEKMIVIDDGSEYCEIEGQKVEKVDFPIESEKNERELPREKIVRPKGNEKMIVIDDGSEYCETEGRKMEDKDQGGIGRNKEKPGRIKKVITVEDGPAFCEKKWKQTAVSDPYNTRQTSSNGSRPRRIEDSICITDPEHLKKNVGERVSYEQRKENQSRKQYSLRSKAKEQKEKSDIGGSEIPSMSSRKPTSTMEANEISVCAKSVSPDMKAPTEQTRNQHGNNDNNYMGSIVDQAVDNYMGSIGDQSVNNYMGSIVDQAVNDHQGSIGSQADNLYHHNGINFMGGCKDQPDNQYSNISSNTGTRSYKCCNSGYMDNLGQHIYNRQHQQHGQGTTNFLNFQHTIAVPQIHAPNIFSFSGYQYATMIPLYSSDTPTTQLSTY